MSATPFTMNDGVLEIPAVFAIDMSRSTFSDHVCAASPARSLGKSALVTPASRAHFSKLSGVSAVLFLNAASWKRQNASLPASANTPCAASAVGRAWE